MHNETASPDLTRLSPPQSGAAQGELPPFATEFAHALQRRHLTTPLLLLLVSHRPLSFIAGQLLYALAPCCALMGIDHTNAWAALLSAPDANQQLHRLISTVQQPAPSQQLVSAPTRQPPTSNA